MKLFFSIRVCFLLLLNAPVLVTFGQSGNFFVTNVTPDEKIDPRSIGMAQDDHGVIYFTNKNGILEFDGNKWRLINTGGAVYTLLFFESELYAGGSFGYGKLVGKQGKASESDFELITNKPNIFSSIVADGKIFFCSENEIFNYSPTDLELGKPTIPSGDENSFDGLYVLANEPYISMGQNGLRRIKGNSLIAPAFTFPEGKTIIFSLPQDGLGALVGTEDGKIFRFQKPDIFSPLVLGDAELLEHQVLVNATLVSGDLVALGTLKGGVFFVDIKTGSTKEIVDYNIGLPDNEVMALFTDKSKGVWIAHEYGFSRVAPYLPFRSFNHYPGLSGTLLCVKEIDGKLFAGTSVGLYYLKTEEKYDEVEIIEASKIAKVDQQKTSVAPSSPGDQQDKTRKRLFGFLKGKRSKGTENVEPEMAEATKLAIRQQAPIARRTKKILKSRQYSYQKVEGIDGKVTQLLEVNGNGIVAGLGGVFLLKGNSAIPIFSEPVNYVHHSTALDQLFISTYDERTISLTGTDKIWRETHYADTLSDNISYIFEDESKAIWFCGRATVYKMEFNDISIKSFLPFRIDNPLFDKIVGLATANQVYVAASGAFHRFEANGFIRDVFVASPQKYFASDGNLWFYDSHHWRTLNQKEGVKLDWLGMFPGIRNLVSSNANDGLWLITANNELYKFTNPISSQDIVSNPLFLREVRGEEVNLRKGKSIRMEQSDDVVEFEFTQPDFTVSGGTEFRYKVNGLLNEWSAWSNDNYKISIPYLPPGDYELAVQSRDIFGKESKPELVSFEVLPHYWKRWWFYALEFSFFTALVIVSIKLSRSDTRYKIISQILSLLTVILFIQFIETGISSFFEFKSSPVVQFFVQLGIAIFIFPVEARFQKFMRSVAGNKAEVEIPNIGNDETRATIPIPVNPRKSDQ